MEDLFLLGNEACALGALDAGVSFAYGYPGTPSTEVMSYLQEKQTGTGVVARWCANEKTAFEAAMGVSYFGKRALVTMKHVGLNVAADAFVNSALQEINGGLVVIAADDPGMHSSQNEQDSRFYADYAKTLCFEPADQQEAYSMIAAAFEASEKFHLPVLFRMVTRLSHSRALVRRRLGSTGCASTQSAALMDEWMCLPLYARNNYRRLLSKQKTLVSFSESFSSTSLTLQPAFREYGVITTGIAALYFREIIHELPCLPSHLHIGTYPIPESKVRELAASVDSIIVIEEGYPFLEQKLRSSIGDPLTIRGKMDASLPQSGELTPDTVRALFIPEKKIDSGVEGKAIPIRFSQLCAGCPHIDTFKFITSARTRFPGTIITADIGCYTLGALPPYRLLNCALCMGASISMARGAIEAGAPNAIALIGDSSFIHSGIAPLVDAVAYGTPMVVLLLDNSTVAMTGGQKTIMPCEQFAALIAGTGVNKKHIRTVVPLPSHHAENCAVLEEELAYRGISVIISRRECVRLGNKTHPGAINHEV